MKNIFLILFLFTAYTYSQEVSFLKEDITFTLDSSHFYVNGFYWFTNSTNKKTEKLIYYPFGNIHNEIVDSVGIFNISAGESEIIRYESEKGFSFILNIEGKDTVLYNIKYRQSLKTDSIIYILTSTQKWQKPLESVEYKLIVNNQVTIKYFSYKPDKLYEVNSEKIYYWNRKNFMPEKDMVFTFKTLSE